ncbi:CG0192-related protein [Spelaeicoccus albus]|uniref:Maltokinase N-terminal cap domain-containing protein n=1 Tax=Spelaeicoccus albus TaxID=1280376 RepID=A0A7Z0A920_9MICO|nr:hypothetical protein [Spelaeicoccus albus]NYI66629.1 hypothetical protein [Spelaeicoccus albus]
MAIMYKADLSPTKAELIARWLPLQQWMPAAADDANLQLLGSFRFDDPDGEVGLETHLARLAGTVAHVPLSYRGAPLDGAEPGLLGTMEHSVLGTRWIYDAAWDPTYWTGLAAAILDRMPQAEQFFAVNGGLERAPETAHIDSSGTLDAELPPIRDVTPKTDGAVTTVSAGDIDISIFRVIDTTGRIDIEPALTATWAGQSAPVQIAGAALH